MWIFTSLVEHINKKHYQVPVVVQSFLAACQVLKGIEVYNIFVLYSSNLISSPLPLARSLKLQESSGAVRKLGGGGGRRHDDSKGYLGGK